MQEQANFDNVDVTTSTRDDPSHIAIEDATNLANPYLQDDVVKNVLRYVRNGAWNNSVYQFIILLCNACNNTKHLYVSIVQVSNGGNPSTSSDIDFYTTLVTASSRAIPSRRF
jgi:predicted neuraminidase